MNKVLQENEIPTLDRTSDFYGISEKMWGLWLQCWDRDVDARPTAAEALEHMSED
jgi:hypothetical protein